MGPRCRSRSSAGGSNSSLTASIPRPARNTSGPEVVPLAELPPVTEAALRAFLAAAEAMLRTAGGQTQKERDAATGRASDDPTKQAQPETTIGRSKAFSGLRSGAGGEGFFKAVNHA